MHRIFIRIGILYCIILLLNIEINKGYIISQRNHDIPCIIRKIQRSKIFLIYIYIKDNESEETNVWIEFGTSS